MGRLWNEMTPQAKRSTANARTKKRRSSAKSTSPRIMRWRSPPWLLLDRVLEDEGVRHDALTRLEACQQFLHVARQHLTARHFLPLEPAAGGRNVDPLAIVQVQDGRRGYDGAELGLLTVEGRGHEHAHAQQTGIGDFDAHFRGPNCRVQDRPNITDAALQDAVGIRGEVDVRRVSDANGGQIVL